jgi:SAM-dependent methyltransferase
VTSDADRIIGLYQRNALAFDGERSRALFEKGWLDRFLSLLPPQASVLDLGCGSGEPIARYVIERGHTVTGVDSAPAMIGLCQKRFPDQRWIIADMRKLDLEQQFDGFLAWDSFFHLTYDDQRGMFAVFRRHAKPKAALMYTSGPSRGEAIGQFHGEPLYHASLDPSEYRALLDDNGFGVVSHRVEDPVCGGHTIWLAQRP